MTITTSWTLAQLTAVETAYASAVASGSHNGKSVTWRQLAEMERIMNTMRVALGVVTEANSPTVSFAEFRDVGDENA